jgi:hypothetical protein
VDAARINTSLALASGTHAVTVVAWDKSGKSYNKSVSISVGTTATTTAGGVTITSPGNGATVSSPVQFVASAQASSGKTITAMQIYVDNVLAYKVNAASLNTSLSLASGAHYIVIQAWDSAGTVYKTPRNITVGNSSTASGHSVVLNWKASTSSGVSGYNVYRGTQSGSYSKVTSSVVAGTGYTDSSVSAGATYYYVVTAVNTSGTESGYSTPATATVP